jgi:hypothetical protein
MSYAVRTGPRKTLTQTGHSHWYSTRGQVQSGFSRPGSAQKQTSRTFLWGAQGTRGAVRSKGTRVSQANRQGTIILALPYGVRDNNHDTVHSAICHMGVRDNNRDTVYSAICHMGVRDNNHDTVHLAICHMGVRGNSHDTVHSEGVVTAMTQSIQRAW